MVNKVKLVFATAAVATSLAFLTSQIIEFRNQVHVTPDACDFIMLGNPLNMLCSGHNVPSVFGD